MYIDKLKVVVVLMGLGACSWFATDHGPVSKRTRGGPLPAASKAVAEDGPIHSSTTDAGNPKKEAEEKAFPKEGPIVHCDPTLAGEIGQIWYTYTDNECHRGGSEGDLKVLAEGTAGKSCQVRWTGRVTAGYQYGYTGLATHLGKSSLVGYRKIKLKARGDGRNYRFQLPMTAQINTQHLEDDGCTSRDHDMFGKEFVCGDGTETWKEIEIDIQSLKQEGWGRKWTFDMANVSEIQVQTRGSPISSFQCDFEIVSIE